MENIPARNMTPSEQPEAPSCPACDTLMEDRPLRYWDGKNWECHNILCEDCAGIGKDDLIDALREYAIEADAAGVDYVAQIVALRAEKETLLSKIRDLAQSETGFEVSDNELRAENARLTAGIDTLVYRLELQAEKAIETLRYQACDATANYLQLRLMTARNSPQRRRRNHDTRNDC